MAISLPTFLVKPPGPNHGRNVRTPQSPAAGIIQDFIDPSNQVSHSPLIDRLTKHLSPLSQYITHDSTGNHRPNFITCSSLFLLLQKFSYIFGNTVSFHHKSLPRLMWYPTADQTYLFAHCQTTDVGKASHRQSLVNSAEHCWRFASCYNERHRALVPWRSCRPKATA